MTIQKNTWLKAGLTLSAAGLFLMTSDSEASASQSWVPRTVLEIEKDITHAKEAMNSNQPLEYTVKWGDTLWGVSQATDISVDKLAKVNEIDNRHMIIAGSTVYISKDLSVVSVQKEEEVVSYDVSEDEVKETETPKEVEEAKEDKKAEEKASGQAAAEQKAEEEAAAQAVAEQEAEEEAAAQAAAEQEAEEEAAAQAAAEQEAEEAAAQAAAEQKAEEEAAAQAAAEQEAAETKTATSSNTANQSAAQEESGQWMSVEATAYSRNQPVLSNFTYTGIDLRENPRVIAVDPNVIPLGSRVFIPGYGEYLAGDTGGAIKGSRIDLHMESVEAALQFGRRQLDIKILD